MRYLILLLLPVLFACTDATLGTFEALGDSAHVLCYSGGELIFDGHSTGAIGNSETTDGYFFKQADGSFVTVNGDCVVEYK